MASGDRLSFAVGALLVADGAVNIGVGGLGLSGSGALAVSGVGAPVAGLTATGSAVMMGKGP